MAPLLAVIGYSAVAQHEWPHYGGNQWNERHATVSQITKDNVAQFTSRLMSIIWRGVNIAVEAKS